MGCREYEPLIERMLAEEIGDGERDRLLAHAEACTGCREFIDLHYQLQDPEQVVDLPTEGELAAMRGAVMRRIRAERADRSERVGFMEALRALMLRPAHAAGVLAVMVMLLALGVYAGQQIDGRIEVPEGLMADQLLSAIREEAQQNRRLSDVENATYLYSNVNFDDLGDDTVSVSFDVTRHMELARPKDDPLVKEMVAQSLVNPSPLGTRLQALGYAARHSDPKIKQALIFSMLNDSTLAVRLKAMNILKDSEPDEENQAAMVAVLAGEESVQMRLLAMDYLVASEADAGRMDRVLDELRRVDDRAVLARAARYTEGDLP